MGLIAVLLIVVALISHIVLDKLGSVNNLWVSYGVNTLCEEEEEKIKELHEMLSEIEDLEEFLRDDRYFRSNKDNLTIAKYVNKEKRFKLLLDGGLESRVSFSYKKEEGCSCNLENCEVINKGLVLKFIL